MKTPQEIFKQVLEDLGFSDYKPNEMSNSDYWLCTSTAIEQYADQFKSKAESYDKLEAEIAKCYVNENGEELDEDESEDIDLVTIGEIAASHFGWL